MRAWWAPHSTRLLGVTTPALNPPGCRQASAPTSWCSTRRTALLPLRSLRSSTHRLRTTSIKSPSLTDWRRRARALPGLCTACTYRNHEGDLVDLEAWRLKGPAAAGDGTSCDACSRHCSQGPGSWRPGGGRCWRCARTSSSQRTAQAAVALGVELPVASFSSLGDASLEAHWQAIQERILPRRPSAGGRVTLSRRLDLAALDLPWRLMARRMGWGHHMRRPTRETRTLFHRILQGRGARSRPPPDWNVGA